MLLHQFKHTSKKINELPITYDPTTVAILFTANTSEH